MERRIGADIKLVPDRPGLAPGQGSGISDYTIQSGVAPKFSSDILSVIGCGLILSNGAYSIRIFNL